MTDSVRIGLRKISPLCLSWPAWYRSLTERRGGSRRSRRNWGLWRPKTGSGHTDRRADIHRHYAHGPGNLSWDQKENNFNT